MMNNFRGGEQRKGCNAAQQSMGAIAKDDGGNFVQEGKDNGEQGVQMLIGGEPATAVLPPLAIKHSTYAKAVRKPSKFAGVGQGRMTRRRSVCACSEGQNSITSKHAQTSWMSNLPTYF